MVGWSLLAVIPLSLMAGLIILFAGSRLSAYADEIGERFAIGKTLVGAVLLGATTSLPGIVASVTAALRGNAELAAANAVGGIAAQTAFLAVGDLFYRRANLEHDAASIGNIVQSALLLVVITIPLVAALSPLAADWSLHPATVILVIVYIGGLFMVRRSQEHPMWLPRGGLTEGVDQAPEPNQVPAQTSRLVLATGICALLVAVSGWILTVIADTISSRYGISNAAIGALGIAIVTSLPELITTIAAVRRGALSLAVGGVMGGNAFDVLFLAAADGAYSEGSIYHNATMSVWFQLALTCTMVAILILGLSLRQRSGPGNIGLESSAVLLCYLIGAAMLIVA